MAYLMLQEVQNRLNYWHYERGMKWREIANLPDYYGIPFGTLERIAKGRDPQDPITRGILGLEPHSDCGQCFRFNKYIKRATRRPKHLIDMPAKMILAMFEGREEL